MNSFIFRTDPVTDVTHALEKMYINAVESGDEHRHFAIETLDALADVEQFSRVTKLLLRVLILHPF